VPHNDSDPSPTLPADMVLWDEAEMHEMRHASPLFAETVQMEGVEPVATIGHIGRYALKDRLGQGGLGTVYAAHDPLLSRLIAVKTLHLEIGAAERESFNAMFLNEARAAGGLNHSHIVTVFDAGISDDRAYIAMELLKGRDLRQLREEGWSATPAQAALIVRRVADALGYAHSKGVVHRDIKPANIFMIGRTQPKVLDFGIARVAHHHDAGHAGADIIAGSPYYMAPEQARQETVDRRADVFSLGVVLYELLTDVKPFRGETLEEITAAVIEHEPASASSINPAVPEALAEITAKAMAKNPDHRYRSARALSRDLRMWLDENTIASDNEPLAAPSKPKALWIAAAAVIALLVGGLVWKYASSDREGAAATAAAPKPRRATAVAAATVAAAPPAPTVPATAPVDAAATPAAPTAATAATAPAADATSSTTAAALVPNAEPVAALAAAGPGAAALKPGSVAPKAAKETPKERRAREARERDAAAKAPGTAKPAALASTGLVHVAISPWGELEVDGKPAGTSPPLTELTLSEGKHQIVVRNSDLPAYSTAVSVTADQPVTLKHKF
jgi:eukaryotic-like serine/threonine-protein kinase